jgi:hypothetical protein
MMQTAYPGIVPPSSNHQVRGNFDFNNFGDMGGNVKNILYPYGMPAKLTDDQIKNTMVNPDNIISHVRNLILARDFIDNIDETGLVTLQVTDPDFIRANSGLIIFTNSRDSKHHQTVKVVNSMKELINESKQNGSLSVDVPLGIVDVGNEDLGGNILKNFFKIEKFPTIVYKDLRGHYHHFNGPRTVVAAIKYACEHDNRGECNVIDYGNLRFEEPEELGAKDQTGKNPDGSDFKYDNGTLINSKLTFA